ncbi:MAG TPA: bifunctional oligoribonuclease/PAP phosphatase NrnA [Clostridia bacterium]|jgi:phosphoesterase RecJ-like protein|nr:bifunctional oligoribonuclease/PAP phosphatase NrnA [Clostridia bacterium]
MYQLFKDKIQPAEKIAIFMHINPDADCFGSSLAMHKYLNNLGKNASVFLEPGNVIRKNLEYFPNANVVQDSYNSKDIYDLGICLDCATIDRMGKKSTNMFINNCDEKLWIDHHEYTDKPPKNDSIIDSKAGATAQILFEIFEYYDSSKIDKEIAACLYGAIAADTGIFSFSSTTAETLTVASKLLKYNINGPEISMKVYKERTVGEFRLMASVLNNAKFYFNNKLGIITFKQNDFEITNTNISSTEGIINSIIEIEGVLLAVAIAEENNQDAFKISVRSKHNINANEFARYFGGGGHKHASGCKINKPYDQVISNILYYAEKLLQNDIN